MCWDLYTGGLAPISLYWNSPLALSPSGSLGTEHFQTALELNAQTPPWVLWCRACSWISSYRLHQPYVAENDRCCAIACLTSDKGGYPRNIQASDGWDPGAGKGVEPVVSEHPYKSNFLGCYTHRSWGREISSCFFMICYNLLLLEGKPQWLLDRMYQKIIYSVPDFELF